MDLDNYRLRSGRVRDRVRVRDKDRVRDRVRVRDKDRRSEPNTVLWILWQSAP